MLRKTNKHSKYYTTPNGIQFGQGKTMNDEPTCDSHTNKWSRCCKRLYRSVLAKPIATWVTPFSGHKYEIWNAREIQQRSKDIKHCQWGYIWKRSTNRSGGRQNENNAELGQINKNRTVQSHRVGFGTGHIICKMLWRLKLHKLPFWDLIWIRFFKST